jgi:hypothetical protein
MRPLLRAALAVAAFAILDGAPASFAQNWIADIRAVPQRHVNREVTVEGQVMAATPNPPGTTRGAYLLVDDSDPNGIAIRTRDLPPPGREYSVTGTVIQDPQTGAFMIDEISRSPIGRPAWLFPALIALGVVVLLLAWALVRTMRKPAAAGPSYGYAAPSGSPGGGAGAVAPTVRPAVSVPTATAPTAAAPGSRVEATEVLDSGQKTEVFRSLGVLVRITEGPDAGKTFPIGKPLMLIGRRGRRNNDITLADTSISREQARISYNEESGSFTLVNESETNPTRVDGMTIDAKELTEGARIEMGRTVFVLERTK